MAESTAEQGGQLRTWSQPAVFWFVVGTVQHVDHQAVLPYGLHRHLDRIAHLQLLARLCL
jgi:hypothetical protein